MVVASIVGGVLVFAAAWAAFVDDPFGGQPVATAMIQRTAPPRSAAALPNAGAASPDAHGPPAAIVRNGVPVVRPGDAMPKSGPVIIRVPGPHDDEDHTTQEHAQPTGGANGGAVDQAMLEDSRYGPLPRIAPDGRRPLDAYARAAPKPIAGGAKVALVVAGLGVGREATLAALRALPPEASLAFSPYAADIGELVAEARRSGREVLMQAPMEPFDYPANDPGPQTLLTGLPASANLERLRWSLGRASGYIGVAPLAGGRFLEAEPALQPVFTELARRGLMFVGAAGRADQTEAVAGQARLPRAPGAIVIDAAPDAAEIDAALARLERSAKAGAVAVGWASASPLTLKRIEAWRVGLAGRGVTLVPLSAAVGPSGPS